MPHTWIRTVYLLNLTAPRDRTGCASGFDQRIVSYFAARRRGWNYGVAGMFPLEASGVQFACPGPSHGWKVCTRSFSALPRLPLPLTTCAELRCRPSPVTYNRRNSSPCHSSALSPVMSLSLKASIDSGNPNLGRTCITKYYANNGRTFFVLSRSPDTKLTPSLHSRGASPVGSQLQDARAHRQASWKCRTKPHARPRAPRAFPPSAYR